HAVAGFVNTVLRPDLVVNTGDVALSNPDADDDHAAARELHHAFSAPVRFVPGNHDVGAADDRTWWATTSERVARYRGRFGESPRLDQLGDVALIGLNSQVFGSGLPEEDEQWRRLAEFAEAVRGRTVILFQHLSFWTEFSGSSGRLAPGDRGRILEL